MTPPAAYGSGKEGGWSLSPGSFDEGESSDAGGCGFTLEGRRAGPDRWLGPDTTYGRVCGRRPGVPFAPPCVCCSYCQGPGVALDSPPFPYDPTLLPLGWGEGYCGPPGRPEGWDGILCHSPPRVSRDGCPCGTLCLCVIEFQQDGRLSLAGPKVSPGGSSETTPDRRRPRAPTVVMRLARRLPCVGHATYGSVLVPYRHLEPGRFYDALHSMRRVCWCNPPWVRSYREDMGQGPYSDRPCDCGRPWRRGGYRPSWPCGVIDHMDPGYESSVRPVDRFRAVSYPDDPEIVDNPYRVGLFLGAPQLCRSEPTYFPAPPPACPSVTFGAPASSSNASCLFPPGGDWQVVLAGLSEERDAGVDGDRRRCDGGLRHARPGDTSGQGYPVSPRVAHREGQRESVRYAYRGTVVGEASRPGLVDPGVSPRSESALAGRRWSLIGPCEDGSAIRAERSRLWPAR